MNKEADNQVHPGETTLSLSKWPQSIARARTLIRNILLPALFILIVILFFHSRGKFEFSFDEGLELMKGALVEEGYLLYDEIWSDQPPIFTYGIAGVIRLAGMDVGAARFMVLISAAVLLWSAFKILEILFGKWQAAIGVVLIFLLPKFMVLSVSVMAGLPAITLAMLSLLAVIFWHIKHKSWFLILSAAFLSFSIFTKLFTGILAPIIIAGLLVDAYIQNRGDFSWKDLLKPAFTWGIGFSIISFLLLVGFVGLQNISLLLEGHFSAPEFEAFANEQYTLTWYLSQSAALLFMGILGAVIAFRQKNWLAGYLAAWAVTAILVFFNYRPIWDHHLVLITIPTAMLASVTLYEAWLKLIEIIPKHFRLNFQSVLILLAVLASVLFVFDIRVPDPIQLLANRPSLVSSGLEIGPLRVQFLEEMRKYQSQTRWVVTDLPMYAFRSDLLVPPEIAVISAKRFETGHFTDDDLLTVIKTYNPEQILLGRFDYPSIDGYMDLNYKLIHADDEIKLFVRNDLDP